MAVAVRAFLSIVMLAGFYVLAFVQFVLGIALAVWVTSVTTGYIGAKVGVAVFLGTVWAVGYGTWKALRADRDGPPGIPLTLHNAPLLWQAVYELSAAVGTRAPDEVHLVAEVNAAVSERTRLMGLIGGRRLLYVGMPLLQTFTVAQLRSVLAHELGHYSGRHTRFAGISYRGRLALERTIGHLSQANVAGWVFRGYARLFILVEHAVSRRQELEADLASVRVAGRYAAAGALQEVEVLDTAFDFYMSRFVLPGLEAGYVPEDLFGGFAAMLRARAEEISALRAGAAEASRCAGTEPLGHASAAGRPGGRDHGRPGDDRHHRQQSCRRPHRRPRRRRPGPAGAGAAARRRGPAAVGRVPRRRRRRRAAGGVRRHAAGLHPGRRSAGRGRRRGPRPDRRRPPRRPRRPDPARRHPPRGPQTLRRPPRHPARPRRRPLRRGPLAALLDRPGALLGVDGSPLDLADVAGLALRPGTLPAARQRLLDRGIDVTAAKHVRRRVGTERAAILAGITTAIVDGKRADLLILSHGLLLMPGMPRYKTGMARYRMRRWLAGGDPQELAATAGSRFIPYEEIATAVRTTKIRFRWVITLHDGTVLELRNGGQSEEHAGAENVFAKAMHAATT